MIRISEKEAAAGRILSTYDPETKRNRRPKYGNRRIKTEDGWFDSVKEARRYADLKLMEQAGLISSLQRQVVYEILPPCDRYARPLTYIADFVYIAFTTTENGRIVSHPVVEDVKSAVTAADKTYKLKKRLMHQLRGIDITEV